MSDPVQELVNAIAGMRDDLTRVYEQIDQKAATPEQLKALAAAIGQAAPEKLAENVKLAAAIAASEAKAETKKTIDEIKTLIASQDVISKRLQSVEIDALNATKNALAVAVDVRKNVVSVGLFSAVIGMALGLGTGWLLWNPPMSYTKATCEAAGGNVVNIMGGKDDKDIIGYRCGFPAAKDIPPPPPLPPSPTSAKR